MNCSAISPSRRLGVVCYSIASNFTSSQRAQINNAMSQFQDETTIRFLEVSACSVNVTMIGGKAICGNCLNYANINNWDAGCYAAVGFQNADPQVLNLNAACFDDLTGTGRDNCILPTRDACDEKASEVLGQRMKLSPLDLESVVQLYGNVTTRQRCIELGHKECPCEEGRGQPNSTPPSPATSSNGFFPFLAELTRWFA
ncbi:hypothetical protein DYB30_011277 [Aphanomyces astaci]|uniref:Peptidase M12A domain-containing protein n=1 Tax=Aphanomyces astaci TaxID=112090 RepID=A0A397CLK5_APHAT|nr:hypothetical protein DYB30_011277 [Aphanomyces astaci]